MIISGALVLDRTFDNGDNPLIGWRNLVTAASVAADTAMSGYPASNLANPATYLDWRGDRSTLNAPATQASPFAAVTYIDRSAAMAAGRVIRSMGVYSNTAGTFTVKIVKRNSLGNYDIVVSQAFSHPGGGWADSVLSTAYTVPAGTYYLGVCNNTVFSNVDYASSSARSYVFGDSTGTGQSGFTEDYTGVAVPPLRYAFDQYLTATLDGLTDIDYVAIAVHNFGSRRIMPSIEVLFSGTWTEIIPAVMPGDDGPILWRLPLQQGPSGVRVKLAPTGLNMPRAAVLYVGKLLIGQRRIYAGHTPLPHGRKSRVTNGRSDSGNFLGRIVTGAWRETVIPFRLITPAWYRQNMDSFLSAGRELPFFFAWRPSSYPQEVGFCWITGDDPMPVPDSGAGNLIAFSLQVRGVV